MKIIKDTILMLKKEDVAQLIDWLQKGMDVEFSHGDQKVTILYDNDNWKDVMEENDHVRDVTKKIDSDIKAEIDKDYAKTSKGGEKE